MKLVVPESVVELAALIASAVGSAVLTLLGTVAEAAALENLLAGHLVLGAWEAAVGGLVLVVGVYLLGYGECWPRLRAFLHAG